MKTFTVVEYLNVLEDISPRFFPGAVFAVAVDPLALHGPEEALHGCIVPAVAFSAHGSDNPVTPEFHLVRPAGVLAASVRMKD